MTLAFHGKSRRRQSGLVLVAAGALLLAIAGGMLLARQDAEAAPQGQYAVYTSIENVTASSTCPTGGGNGVNCNIYLGKEQVYLNGGPASSFLPDGWYCFSVYSPNQGTLLSSDAPAQRTFQVVNNPPSNPISYAGNHDVGTDTREATTTTTIQFMPYDDTPNPGGTYKYTLYRYSSAPTHPAGNECNTADAVAEKTDNFKVAEDFATIWIKKVTVNDPGGAQPRFSADVIRLGDTNVVEGDDIFFDVSSPASQVVVVDIDKGQGSDTFRVDENTPPANWSVTGKKVLSGANANCEAAGTPDWTTVSPGSASGDGLSSMKDGDAVTVCFRNEFAVPGTGSIEIHKDDSQANDPPETTPNAVAGATFKLEGPSSAVLCVTDDSTSNASTTIDSDAAAACAGASLRDDEDDTGGSTLVSGLGAGPWTITEVARPDGYGPDECGGIRFVQLAEQQSAVIDGPGCEATNPGTTAFHNPPIVEGGTVWNVKVVVNDPADQAVFTADVTGPSPNSDVSFAQGAPHSYSATAGTGYDSVEDPPGADYQYIGTFLGDYDGGPLCDAQPPVGTADLAILAQLDGTLDARGNLVFCHYNIALGTVVVEKLNLSSLEGPFFVELVADGSSDEFLEVPDGGSDSVIREVGSAVYSIGQEFLSNEDEVFFGPDICLRDPEGSFFTVALLSANATLDFAGDEVRFRVTNQDCGEVLATGNLRIEKWNDLNGNGIRDGGEPAIPNWPVTVSGPEFPGGQAFLTNASGVVALDGIATGVYTVTEGSQVGWYQTGLVVNAVPQVLSATAVVSVAESSEEAPATTVVQFGNRQLATVIVIKTVNDQVGIPPRGVGGWQINLAGCGTSINKVTDGSGTAVFSNLLPADNCAYTVTETNTEGFAVSYPVGQVVAPGPGASPTVRVHNSRTPIITFETPTPTPTATATPTDTPSPTPTDTPEPTETVAGERTPGLIATPIAPETGTGFRGSGAAGSLGLAVLGLVAVTAGMMLLSLGRRKA